MASPLRSEYPELPRPPEIRIFALDSSQLLPSSAGDLRPQLGAVHPRALPRHGLAPAEVIPVARVLVLLQHPRVVVSLLRQVAEECVEPSSCRQIAFIAISKVPFAWNENKRM